jgi:HPr kinase/phosphorylase
VVFISHMDYSRIQAVLVVVHGIGVLIRGRPGSGKSLAALNLMRRGHKLVSDDLVELAPAPDGELWGRAVEEDARIEIRGLGIYRAKTLFPDATALSSPIHLVIDLDEYDSVADAGRMIPETGVTRLLGRDILTVRVPAPIGSDPAFIIELLAKRFRESGSVNP